MIQSLGQIMLYVTDMEMAVDFWEKQVGFKRVEKQVQGGQVSYILAPHVESDVQLVLHDKATVSQMNPELNVAAPSILMATKDIEKTYQEFIEKGITANPIANLGFMKVFNFCDKEGNYFAVREVS